MQLSESTSQASTPIFITGSVRSGTSIVRNALVHGAGIPGYTEGCFIDILGVFVRMADFKFNKRVAENRKAEIMLTDIPKEVFLRELATWFRNQYETYIPYSGMWVDKTPDNDVLHAVEYIQYAWPSAKFIFMKRRPIENILSRLRKFPERTFEQHCRGWTKIMCDTIRAKQVLAPGSYIEIDQYDIAKHPEQVAMRLGVFLNLPMRDIKKIQAVFEHERPEFTGGNEVDTPSFEDMPWTTEEKLLFMETCGTVLEAFGWSLDHVYYQQKNISIL